MQTAFAVTTIGIIAIPVTAGLSAIPTLLIAGGALVAGAAAAGATHLALGGGISVIG